MTFPSVCESPIFIIGSPRSGTSILAWALAQHSALTTSSESNMLFELFGEGNVHDAYAPANSRPDDGDWLREFDVSTDEFLAAIGLGLNALVTGRSGGRRWIDQTPANTMVAATLARAFPDAKFVHIVRDGRGVVNSMINFAAAIEPEAREQFAQPGAMPEFAIDFEAACTTWAQYVAAAGDFTANHPDRAHTVRNEALQKNPEAGFERLLLFLGLEPEPAVSTYFRETKLNSSFPEAPIPGGRDTPWDDWTSAQWTAFHRIAGSTMTQLARAARIATPA